MPTTRSSIARVGLTLALGAVGALALAGPAAAQGACEVTVNDRPVEGFGDWRSPLVLDLDERADLVFAGTSKGGEPVEVSLEFAGIPSRIPIATVDVDRAGRAWEIQTPWDRYAWAGVGLYHVVATGGGCEPVEGWVKVVGRSPFTTVAGLAATGVVLIGVVLLVLGIVRAAGGKGGLALSVIGGASTGLGGLVLAQQSGVVPITEVWTAAWVVGPGLVGGVANRVVAGRAAGGRRPTPPSEPPGRAAGTARAEPSSTTTVAGAGVPPEADRRTRPPAAEPPEPAPAPAGPPPAPTAARSRWWRGARAPRPSETTAAEAPPSDEVATAAGAPPPERDPPRSAFALLSCPGVVVAGAEFDLLVGLSATPTPGVAAGAMTRPEWSVGPYTLSVQVVADGFALADPSDRWRRELRVTADAAYPSTALRLRAESSTAIVTRGIRAIFSIEGQTIGMAVRSVAIAPTPELARTAQDLPPEGGVDIPVPAQPAAPDLTVRIVHGVSESDGRLLWTFETKDPSIDVPDGPVGGDIGAHPESFARQLVDQIAGHEGKPGLYQYVMGIANTVTDEVPQELWDILRAVAARTGGRPPTVLILSEEPFVPWELAVVDPPLAPALPPFLCAQARVGRWVLARRRPSLPPPAEVRVAGAVVVSGVYGPEWRLVEAEQEAAELGAYLGATAVDARVGPLIACLEGQPRAEILHVAVHGLYNPGGTKEGLILVDGQALDPFVVKGARIAGAPFVFLNACQVGSGAKVLGNYAGMAESLLYAGAAGVVAPLWSVDDAVAREVAIRFYRRVVEDGESPAEVFRQERARFTDDADGVSSTYLAYQFFGNPEMTLSFTR